LRKLLYRPKVKVSCPILHKQCLFVNYGDPGEACVRVRVFHFASGRTLDSAPVCSGHIDRDDPRWVGVDFGGEDPTSLCMGEDYKLDFKKNCSVEVVQLEER